MITFFKWVLFLLVDGKDIGFGELFVFGVLSVVVNLLKPQNLLNLIIRQIILQLKQLMGRNKTACGVICWCAVNYLSGLVFLSL